MTTWISTTESAKLQEKIVDPVQTEHSEDLQLTGEVKQEIKGFGGCFNELGYQAIEQYVSEENRETIYKELFSPEELNFTFNRAPVGANDFAEKWYSYDEIDGDYSLDHFSVENDEHSLIPYIHHAQKYQPNLQLFSSPWSPPTWMKFPKVYNFGRLVMTPENLTAYAQYFVKYVKAYAEHGIPVSRVFVQNEVFADQKFCSCLYRSEDMKIFIRDYLGPAFEEAGLDTQIYLGTLNGPEDMAWTAGYGMRFENYNRWVDNILFDDNCRKYIKGVGYQWAGQNDIQRTHESWPELDLLMTESECGMGDNTWEYAEYIFHLINHYIKNGASGYTYWNMVLTEIVSTWGWQQNSLFRVNSQTGEFVRTPEYYLMRHFSHYVKPGARLMETSGHFNSMGIAFRNPDGTIVLLVQNALDRDMPFTFADPQHADKGFKALLPARSFNTFLV
ncbi:glycosyl hydrolases family 30 [Scardovia inopinata]|uniref:Glycosyl hydrolase family 30 TIM-barrel domain-containing protein n=1 Tax=Scardovia inopinata F0304 TaxID=641146 RepID=W5IGZ2_SCAIO|nr:glycoside hydrolase family 30 protein [Scardovia inopinata]EFG26247.1 hypothetical protein HMPREF9020_01329 [Scardovia inopinata F0304]BAR07122.1 glycosyl hydrolase [Scardovia inopinata JCM 12537]SUV51192.1 glycosyl hydrolases family 30 [Scardovia inopinata]